MTRSTGPRSPAASRVTDDRDLAVDQLKVVLTMAVIVAHVAITYGAPGDWFYIETPQGGALQSALSVPIALGALFAMGAFFFVAGCFVTASLLRKGSRRYATDRLIRLGLPTAAFVVLMVPALEWCVGWVAGPYRSLAEVLGDQARTLDTGPLWFAAVLLGCCLLTSLASAARIIRLGPDRDLTVQILVVVAIGISALSFLIRSKFPIDTFQIGSLHLWQWGQCVGLFGLGVWCGRSGLGRPSIAIQRASKLGLLVGVIAVAAILSTVRQLSPLGGGWYWQSAVVAVVEGVVSVSAAVVLLGFCRVRPHPRLASLGPAAFGAYVVQAPVIVGLSLLVRTVHVDAEIKLVVVAVASVVLCFAIATGARRLRPVRGERRQHDPSVTVTKRGQLGSR